MIIAALMLLSNGMATAWADDEPVIKLKMECVARRTEGQVPLAPADDASSDPLSLDIDAAKKDLSNAIVRRTYDVPNPDGTPATARISFAMRYLAADGEKTERVEITKLYSVKEAPPPPAPRSRRAQSPRRVSSPPSSSGEPPKDKWKMLAAFGSPIVFKLSDMLPRQGHNVGTPKIEGVVPEESVPAHEVECELVRIKVKQDCPNCR